MGLDHLDAGSLNRDRKGSIGYLPQEIHPLKHGTVFENMLAHLGPWTEADRKLKEVMKGLETGTRRPWMRLTTRWRRSSPPVVMRWKARAKAILLGLGFSVPQLEAPVKTLSGGWAMRLALGGLLAFQHDLLLLDEPTNHLDLLSVKWFEDFLQSYSGAILITCHDRDFLDRVITKTFELDMGKLHTYPGNYSAHLPQKDHRLAVQQASFDGQQKMRPDAGLRRPQPGQRLDGRPGTEPDEGHRKDGSDRGPANRHRDDADQAAGTAAKRPGGRQTEQARVLLWEKKVYDGLDLEIDRGDRVVLVGPNGAGKTTLMKLFAGLLEPSHGERILGTNVFPTYFAQHRVEAARHEGDCAL